MLAMRRAVPILAILAALYFGWARIGDPPQPGRVAAPAVEAVEQAYSGRVSGVQVRGEGRVVHILPDDDDGSRHQRFILELASGQTLLVAHNIDLAARLAGLQEGDVVAFNGVYEWNSKGGLIHWTHRDPGGRHEAGWLQHNGRTYQ